MGSIKDVILAESFALGGSTRDYRDPSGPALLERTEHFLTWQQARVAGGFWPYSRTLEGAPEGTASILDSQGCVREGVNFASQDYLSLATSADVKDAAIEAIRKFGVHSAGSAAVVGNTRLSLQLENELAGLLDLEHVTLYPTGWAAGYGVSRGLVRQDDYVVMDALSHSCLQEGAYTSTRNVSLYGHLDHQHARSILTRIRKHDAKNAILVITEGLFSMDADTPDIERLQAVCHEFEATLVVDVAHDLGAMGPGGTGALGVQDMLGKVDLVMGSFSKSFASNGGFVASKHASVKQHLKVFSPSQTFSNALSPAQAAAAVTALHIIRSARGQALRDALMRNIEALRAGLQSAGATVMGSASPIVPVLIGREDHARLAASELPRHGVLTNLAEYPGVPRELARFRMQVMAHHTLAQAEHAARGVALAIAEAKARRP
jgi:glycine C-acetyltransferase